MADQPQHWDSTAQLLQAELLHASSSVRGSKCLFKLLFSKIKPAISVGKYLLQPSVFLTENGKKGLFNCCKRSTEKSLIILQGLLMLRTLLWETEKHRNSPLKPHRLCETGNSSFTYRAANLREH